MLDSWHMYVAVAAIYTALILGLQVKDRKVFSERNGRPLWAIFGIHLASLVILSAKLAGFFTPKQSPVRCDVEGG